MGGPDPKPVKQTGKWRLSRAALRADGSLLGFRMSWLLHKQGGPWAGAAHSSLVRATPRLVPGAGLPSCPRSSRSCPALQALQPGHGAVTSNLLLNSVAVRPRDPTRWHRWLDGASAGWARLPRVRCRGNGTGKSRDTGSCFVIWLESQTAGKRKAWPTFEGRCENPTSNVPVGL